jgi:hypothetical protein
LHPSAGEGDMSEEENLEALLERRKQKFFKEVKFFAFIVIAILVFTAIQQLLA